MANQDMEIEIKFALKNPLEVSRFLDANAQPNTKSVSQKDTYFVPAHRDFLSVKYPFEWLRIRESPNGASINYKHFYPEDSEVTDYCDEFETKVESPVVLKKILQSLDFKEAVKVEKVRSTWVFENVEVAIDEVKNIGSFIELEAMVHLDAPPEVKKLLYSTPKKNQVGEEDLRGYPYMVWAKSKSS